MRSVQIIHSDLLPLCVENDSSLLSKRNRYILNMHLDKLYQLADVGNQRNSGVIQETCHSETTLSSTSVIVKNTSETLFPHET